MEEAALQELRKHQFIKKGESYYIQGKWTQGENKNTFVDLRHQASIILEKLKISDINTLEQLCNLGKIASKMQKLLRDANANKKKQHQVSIKTLFKKCFGQSANRIYEAIAVHRAVTKGFPKTLPYTTLIKLGERLSKFTQTEQFKDHLKSNMIEVGGELKAIELLTKKELLSALESPSENPPDPIEKSLKDLVSPIKSLKDKVNSIEKLHGWTVNNHKFFNKYRIMLGNLRGPLDEASSTLKRLETTLSVRQDRTSVSNKNKWHSE